MNELFHSFSVSVTGKRGVGIPIILLHDSEGGIVTVELKNGSIYRGLLEDGQDNMNCTLKNCIKIDTNGKESTVELAYVRGSQISFIVLPDTLQHAPFFNRIKMWRKFRGHAIYGANTAAVNAMGGMGRGGGITPRPMLKRPRLDGPGGMGGPPPFQSQPGYGGGFPGGAGRPPQHGVSPYGPPPSAQPYGGGYGGQSQQGYR